MRFFGAVTRPWRRRLAVLAVVCAVGTLYVVAGRGGIQTHGPVVSDERGWITLGGYGNDAGVGGELTLENGCLLLDGKTAVWPTGTRWNDDEETLELNSGATATLGSTISGGGGYFGSGRDDTWRDSDAGRATAACQRPGTEVIVFNRDDAPTVS